MNLLTFVRTPHVIWYFNCGHEYRGLRKWLSRLAYRGVDRCLVYTRHERSVYARVFALPKSRFQFTDRTGARVLAALAEELSTPPAIFHNQTRSSTATPESDAEHSKDRCI